MDLFNRRAKNLQIDQEYVQLLGDLAEVYQQNGKFDQAQHYYLEAKNCVEFLMKEISFEDPNAVNHNSKAIQEEIKLNEQF